MAKGTRIPKVVSTAVEEEIELQSNLEAEEMEDDSVVVVGMEYPIAQEPEVVAELDVAISKETAPSNVRVATKRDHSCTIGGVHYHFFKEKQQLVPVAVKDILLRADLLMPI